MQKGDLVLVPFPFTDLSATKNRPALILTATDKDVTLSFITTQTKWQSGKPENRTQIKRIRRIFANKFSPTYPLDLR